MADRGQTSDGGRAVRPYRSPRRREQARLTRLRILEAARVEFLRSGYAGTTMRVIAAAAGVSTPTLEQAFGTKSALLKQVIDSAIAGDDEPIPVLARAPAARAEAAVTVDEFLFLIAGVLAEGQQRSARLVVVAFEAAAADPSLRSLVQQRLDQRSQTAEWIVDGILKRSTLRPDLDRAHAVDTVWVLMEPVVFCRLTEDRHWNPDEYRRWFATNVALLLSADAPTSQQ
jgi:AcrR family transcriptional regulator